MNPLTNSPRPIFLLGAHKSGTTLLRSLLDAHPDLFVIPKEIHLFQLLGYWIDYALRQQQPQPRSTDELVAAFGHMLHDYNSSHNPYANNTTVGWWDVAAAETYLQHADLSSPFAICQAIFHACHLGLYGTPLPATKRVVEKSVEQAEFALDLQQLYPQATFIHLIRNPYANIVSLRRFKSKAGYPFLKPILFSLYNSYYHLVKNQRLIRPYLVVRYEDLVSDPETTMRQIAQFADLPFSDQLLQPTSLGQPWAGNSVYNTQFTAVSNSSIDRWKEEIGPYEIYLLNQIVPAYVWQTYGYDRIETDGRFFRPMPQEGVKNYLRNQLLRYFI